MPLIQNLGSERNLVEENITVTEQKERLKVQDLKVRFFTSKGIVKAIDNLSFSIREGESYGLVGESGSGKSVTATAVMDLIPDPPGRIIRGKIYIDGFNILTDLDQLAKIRIKSPTDVIIKRKKRLIKRHNYIMSGIRGDKVSMVFQEPFLSMNPVMTIGDQIKEAILLHGRVDIANSIIKRETMNAQEVSKIVDTIMAQPDTQTRNKLIVRLCGEYAIPELAKPFTDLFENSTDRDFIINEVLSLVNTKKTGLNLEKLEESKNYFLLRERILDLNLELIGAEHSGDERTAAQLEAQIKELKSTMRSQFLLYSIKRRFMRRFIDAPFEKFAEGRTLELLTQVNIAGPERVMTSYPHELSGGMLQRCMIAMAFSANPQLLIADEPTTALDVTTQAQILDLMKEVNKNYNTSILFITHDLAVIAEMCDRVGVIYGGNLVEEAPVKEIFYNAKHPYTTGLMNAIPRAERRFEKTARLESIPGSVPNLIDPPSGCRFHPRCKFKMDVCSEKKPKLVEIEKDHKVACFLYSDEVEEEPQEEIP